MYSTLKFKDILRKYKKIRDQFECTKRNSEIDKLNLNRIKQRIRQDTKKKYNLLT